MSFKQDFYGNQAKSIIKKMESRFIDGYYCQTVEEAKSKVLELIGKEKKQVAYGGSMTLDENGFKDAITQAGHSLIVRENYKTPEEIRELKAITVNADFFMCSSNAITLDGELINIDGRGNRVSFLIYGPENVIVVAGMNKIVKNVQEGIDRIRNFASPPNCLRLGLKTPCSVTGKCGECIDPSICSQIVVTRKSMVPHRIKVILVGQELGY